jgi:hypothetical protein
VIFCRQSAPPSPSVILQALSRCTSITSITLTQPIVEGSTLDATCLATLPGLTALTLKMERPLYVEPCECSSAYGTARLTPLTSMTHLCQLMVQGLVPAAADGLQTAFLPASLTKLTLETEHGAWNDPRVGGSAMVQAWLVACGPLQGLQQLHITGLELGCKTSQSSSSWQQDFSQLDFSRLSGLRELRFMLQRGRRDSLEWIECPLPTSLSQLSNLEVLELAIPQSRYPFHGPYLDVDYSELSSPPAQFILANCPKLRRLGHVQLGPICSDLVDAPFEGRLPHLSRLQLKVYFEMPEMINPSCCPSLHHLVVECPCVDSDMVRCLAQLTTLTCLQLNTGSDQYKGDCSMQEGWCGLEALGRSLLLLQRLELIGCFGQNESRPNEYFPLLMPNLSAFTQLKQLQLACALNPHKPLPTQPSPAEFLAGLSVLTQLEQLEVLGYSSVTPELMTDLVTCLPGLRVLEVGLCRHPSLVKKQQARGAGELVEGEEDWEAWVGFSGLSYDGELLPVHQGFDQASEKCQGLKPGLRVQVGYTPQWLR